MATLTLIDGSGFIFRAYHAIPHLSTTKVVPTNAAYGFTTMLLKALREHAPTHVALVFDAGRKSFRNEIDPGYKANRPEAPDDLKVQFPLVRDVARALAVPIVEEAGVEADDVIGTLACRARERGWDVVVVTGDKDFAQLGLALRAPGLDTELASRLLLPTRREHALADVARERISCEVPRDPSGGDAARKSERVPVDGLEVERVATWAGPCAASIVDLAPALERALEETGLAKLHREVEAPILPVLFEMERTGILVDRGAMSGMSEEFGRAMEDLEARIHHAAGRRFNVASTRELAQVLFGELDLPVLKRLKTGPSTDQDVLEKLAEQHELPRLVLEHRALAKLKGTYVDALPLLIDPADGRIHTTFNPAGAATGRLSSTDPNLQNIPIRTDLSRRIRAAFVAPQGRRLLSADYSQIELRILAHYSDDPALLEAFRNREDVHTRTAAETYGVDPSAVTPDMRRVAKMLNFGIAYGLSAFGLSQRLDLPAAEAQAIITRYFARYTGVKRYVESAVEEARRTGESRTLYGRVRAMPEIAARNPALRNAAERTAINTPIQGTAADVVKVAMVRVHGAIVRERLDAQLLLQVHDELVLEVGEAEVEAAAALVKREMEGAASLKVPLDVEVGHGRSWAEAH